MAVVWSTDRGVLELPVQFIGVERVGEIVSAWRVRVTGPAARVQRRHFVRVPYATPVILTVVEPEDDPFVGIPAPRTEAAPQVAPAAAAGGAGLDAAGPDAAGLDSEPCAPALPASPLLGKTVDLSEGGMRCVVDHELPVDTKVIAGFAFGEDNFRLEARIVRSFPYRDRSGQTDPPKWDTGVRFVNPDLSGDVLRKNIFAEQMRLRRSNGR
jgi:hypothetical protein